jgi:hypothetical protein
MFGVALQEFEVFKLAYGFAQYWCKTIPYEHEHAQSTFDTL